MIFETNVASRNKAGMTLRAPLAPALLALLAGCESKPTLPDVPPTLALSSTLVAPIGTLGGPVVTSRVTIVNGTEGTLENLAAAVSYSGAGNGWLAATLDRTTATQEQPATLELRATPGSLGLGVYTALVQVTAQGAGNSPLSVQVRFTVDPRPPAKLAILTQPATQAVNGEPLSRQPVVQLLDATDQPTRKSGVAVTAAVASGGGAVTGSTAVVTDNQGQATFDLAVLGPVGTKTLLFSSPNLASATSAPLSLSAGAAARLEAASTLSQSANAGTNAPDPPRVRVVDQSGNPVAGTTVAFAASAGGVLTPAGPIPSDANGTAGPTTWTLNPVAGANTVTASAQGLAGSPITFSAAGTVGPAARLLKQSGDNLLGLIGTALGTPHVVKVVDAFGNGVDGVSISWAAVSGGSVSPTQNTTAGGGLAQATRTLPGTVGAVSTTASATLPSGPASVSFAVSAVGAGPAQIVKVAGDQQTGAVNTVLATTLRVQVLDAVNAPQPNVTVTFTTASAGGSFPGGASVQTDANGFAATTWQLGTQAGQQEAQAAVGGPAPAVFSATATPGPLSLAQSTVTASPTSFTAGGSTTITVTAKDQFGNGISGQTVALSVTGAGTLTQPAGNTDGLGQTTGTLSATVAGSKIVAATIGGAPVPQTVTVGVLPGPATQVVALTATNQSVRFGQAVGTLPSIQVRDALGNGVPGVAVTFAITSGQSAVLPANTTTNASGTATVSSWIIGAVLAGPAESDVYNQLLVTVAGGGLSGNPVTFTGVATVSFGSDLMPILRDCGACHDGTPGPDFAFDTPTNIYTTLLASNRRYVFPSDSVKFAADTNLVWAKPAGAVSHGGGTSSAKLVTIIKAWIRQGAPNN